MADNTIDNLSIQVTASAEEASRIFDRLASNVGKLKGATSGAAQGMHDAAEAAQDMGTATQEAGEQAGQAQKPVRTLGKDAEKAGKDAKKGSSGLKVFWESLKRIAFYRFVRSIIKSVTEAFSTGISNLYQWSKLIDGHFAASMDRLATSTLYLKNSLGAAASPLIESFVPVLDIIIDKVVEVLNFFNMLVSAISGADTYTVAKKAATVWDDSANKTKKAAKSAADDIKRTILGFDEINKLVKPNSSSGSSGSSSSKKPTDYSSMFEEKPLTGIFKKIADVTKGWPDWLKWLLGIGGAAATAWGISQLPKLLSKIFDWLKKLFAITVPGWFSWLFGPKGNGNTDINLPDDINIPDADITTNIKKGDWSALDDLNGKPVYLSPKLDNKPDVLLRSFVSAWLRIEGRVLYFAPKLDNRAKVLYDAFKKEWDASGSKTLYFSPKLDNKASVLANQFKKDWGKALTTVYVGVALKKDGWEHIRTWLGLDDPVTANIDLRKWGWNNMRTWLSLDDPHTANINLRKWGWSSMRTWLGLDNPISASISLIKRGWSTISNFVGTHVNVDVYLRRGDFYSLRDWLGSWVNVDVYLRRGNFWSLADWLGDSVTVRVNLVMGSGGYINTNVHRSFGSASGGGGGSRGGGAGRGRKANGGVLSNGIWSNIPKYASGTSGAHGTMFIAGEAGPEIVGHIGGRTEVLNKSQLASAMYSAVQAAMAPASANFAAAANYLKADNVGFDMELLADMVQRGIETAMERQRDIQRQQLDTLRQINAKEFRTEITTASINDAQRRQNQRAGIAVAPVAG